MKRYYIDCVEDGSLTFLVGPFKDEASARKREWEVASFALQHGHMSPFAEFGVTAIDGGYQDAGKLNHHFEISGGEIIQP